MKTIVFATNNMHKLAEVRAIVADKIRIVSLSEIGCCDDVPETADTLEGNALQKATYIKNQYAYDCFADDSGLEVDALDGAPGVRSARYAGDNHDSAANIDKLLHALVGQSNRRARFRTVIALLNDGEKHLFEGVVNGQILTEKRGYSGFGYDPVFMPDGYDKTFAELSADVKNNISHRALATRQLVAKLLSTLVILFFMSAQTLTAQNFKNWNMYQSYREATGVAETNERIYVLANGSMYSYGKEDHELILYSKQNGLSDTDIRIIRYNSENKTLVIVYSNGNIDLFDQDGIHNMPDLKKTTNLQSKGVNDIFFHNQYAYLSADFGIMVINIAKKEIADTYKLEKIVKSTCIMGDSILAATDEGLLRASLKDNLLDLNAWKEKNLQYPDIVATDIVRICPFLGNVIYCVKDKGVFYETPDGEFKNLTPNIYIKDITVQSGKLLAYTVSDFIIYTDLENYIYANAGVINDIAALKDDGKYWIASGDNGLICIQRGGNNQFDKIVSDIAINSPKRNNNAFMTVVKNKLFIAGGGRMLTRLGIPGTLSTYENGMWYNFDEMIVNQETNKIIGSYSYDYMGVAVDPNDESHLYIATYGEGIIELKDYQFVKLHHIENSTLVSALGVDPNYVRVGSVCFDKDGNLWAINCLSQNVVNVLKKNGQWVSLSYPPIRNADKIDKLLITSKGHKWVNVPYDNAGIFVFDDMGTIDDTSDDKYNYFSAFKDAQSSSGAMLSATEYLCMIEDKNGIIWLGTSIGLLKINSPSYAIDAPDRLTCSRLVRDNEAYFLSGETVTALAVDADNQKWIGTATQGVFLISADGSETIYNFNTDNSPLLSNTINSLAINNNTGEVFIGTDKGTVSYKSGVIGGGTPFSDVYAFPNPVRPDYNDKVTITGLSNNAAVKITDLSGNLIYQGRAVGNQLAWNCRNSSGNRVATGVYIVFASTPEAAESVVAKIAVVK